MAKLIHENKDRINSNGIQGKLEIETLLKDLSLEGCTGSMATKKVDEIVRKDEKEQRNTDHTISWYHEKMNREAAEKLLMEGHHKDGYFLLRDSSSTSGNFVISLRHKDSVLHFQVTKCEEQVYCIDDGPRMEGLEKLVSYYQNVDMSLPSKLNTFCPGRPPPSYSLKFGRSNILHQSVKLGNVVLVKAVLNHAQCPDVNAKDSEGSTCLHLASFQGNEDVVFLLLEHGNINVNMKDGTGVTPLHKACIANHPKVVEMLMLKGHAEPQERSTETGWVPLHEAAARGYTQCVKVLLSCNAPCRPRNDLKETPRDLALQKKHTLCVEILENYKSPPAKTKSSDWLHHNIDRKDTKKILHSHGMSDGLFIVRRSSKHEGWYVVAVVFGGSTYNYEVRNKGDKVFFIDDGPLLESLEHVIEHYSLRADGLPTRLVTAVKPDGSLLHINIPRPYKNGQDEEMKPCLPPRPQSLAEDHTATTTTDHHSKPSAGHEKHGPTARKLPPPPVAAKPKVPAEGSPVKSTSHHPKTDTSSVAPAAGITAVTKQAGLTIIASADIQLANEVGQGEFGSVMRGKYKTPSGQKVDVAVKTLREEHMQTGKKEFLREAEVMCGLHHSCIVKLIGICDGPPMMLVQELVAMGSLLDYILDYPERINHPVDLYLWAAQIAFGMRYLELKKYVHRDLAARNILLASKTQVKISDFGLSRAVGTGSDYYKASAGGRWPVKWYAPESINYGTFSHASDVWGFGVTLWEMFSYGEQPYGEMTGAQVIAWLEKGKRLPQPDHYKPCPDKVYDVMCQCWKTKASERPTFNQLHQHFETEDEYTSLKEIWNSRQT